MKAYQLQTEGYDTFDANVVLGHQPDGRSYAMVKIVLDDLKVYCIRLLTNNPSKVSEIAKLGIKVVECVPCTVNSNKYNRKYFAAKKRKSHHFFDSQNSYYFYQFHADKVYQVKEIGEFIADKKRDPLLRIFVGVGANHSILVNKEEIKRIEAVFHACQPYESFFPVLHFSFRNSENVIEEMKSIEKLMPFVKRLQANDLPSFDIKFVKLACSLFLADIPISDENFELVHRKQFRDLVKKNHAFLLLDNNKGRGIQESKESLMKKIETMLGYGLNDIAIYGGFGPDELDSYFKLRRYFRLNFSIDAETKLKTNGKIDLEKTKTYLGQLIRFDDPKQEGIEQTRAFLSRHRRNDWDKATIEGHEFLIHPQVFHAGVFPSSQWFAIKVLENVRDQAHFCEVGCGTGVISCLVALNNPKMQIVATDINPFAGENTKLNANSLGLAARIQVRTGDVLDNIPQDYRFDSIFWALPFGYLDPGIQPSLEELQVFDPGYQSIRKFFQSAKKFLKPNGKIFIGFSSDLGHQDLLDALAKESDLRLFKLNETQVFETNQVKFEFLVGGYL